MATRSLDSFKFVKYAEIDNRTDQLIAEGFTFDTKLFALSTNVLVIILSYLEQRPVNFPMIFRTKDNSDFTSIGNVNTLRDFHDAASNTFRSYVDSGEVIKAEIAAQTTPADVAAVIDNR